MKAYSRELKERAVRMALEEGMGYPAITEALGIRDRRCPWWIGVAETERRYPNRIQRSFSANHLDENR